MYHRDGTPADRALLQSLVDFLVFRGPDSREWYTDGPIGLGHTMLRTSRESIGERQPACLEGRFWITADARLDAREELLSELKRSGRSVRPNAPDSELILNAYAAWGTPCVEHLRGDFSFAIWDARNKQLFCARDHFGIKPFYYAQPGHLFVFSNTLNCVRLHPDVPAELNEAAVGDFLLFGVNCDNTTTTFRGIQRLPPAHALSISREGLKTRRYWSPPTDGRIRYAKAEEYVENFQALLQAAVGDRLRTERVGVLMSGGLDSSSVAATTKEFAAKTGQRTDIRCYTHVFRSLMKDEEDEYAREVGEFLGVPVRFIKADETQIFEGWFDPDFSLPEPIENPLLESYLDSCRNISEDCRVVLSGEGGDNLMKFQMWPYLSDLRRREEWQQLITEAANYVWVRPFPWRGIWSRFLKLVGREPDLPVFPKWLATDFAKRANLAERWKQWGEHPKMTFEHPIHPIAHASLSLPYWTQVFELENAGVSQQLLEVRYPFLDLRIVNYLLAIPPFPWFFRKALLREAMTGKIPERVRMRPKTPLPSDPLSARVAKTGTGAVNQIQWTKQSDRYIDRSAVAPPHGKMNPEEVCASFRPYCFNIWLQSASRVRYNKHVEASNG
jgi:asparagine synthase (glutamine-hydrolysing)